MNSFELIKERTHMRQVAEMYGLEVRHNGFVRCPWHEDKTPSLRIYDDTDSFFCFSCHRGGDQIRFVSDLFSLAPLEAARKLNTDLHLGLDLEPHKLTDAERQAVHERERLSELKKQYEQWRKEMMDLLDTVIQKTNMIQFEDPDELTPGQIEAFHWVDALEDWSNTLRDGSISEGLEIFRDRKDVTRRCQTILKHLKSSTED